MARNDWHDWDFHVQSGVPTLTKSQSYPISKVLQTLSWCHHHLTFRPLIAQRVWWCKLSTECHRLSGDPLRKVQTSVHWWWGNKKQGCLTSGFLCFVLCPHERYTSWTFDLLHMRVSIISNGEWNYWSAYVLIYCICKLHRSLSPAQKSVQTKDNGHELFRNDLFGVKQTNKQ